MAYILPDRLADVFIASYSVGPWQTNCYILVADGASSAVVVDAGVGAYATVRRALDERGLALAGVIATHGHVDHIADAARLANSAGVPVFWHGADDFMVAKPSAGLGDDAVPLMVELFGTDALPAADSRVDVADSAGIELAGLTFGLIHAPGHTPGCVVLTLRDGGDDLALTGDVIFAGSVGRTDLPGGDPAQMRDSLGRLLAALGDDTRLLPGHGPETTMARERRRNPYLQLEAGN